MRTIGNILWFIFGGLLSWIGWIFSGLILCVTVIGIPAGVQCFKLASLSLVPFKKDVVYGGSAGSFLLNLIWLIFFGLGLAFLNACIGIIWCITIVGFPFGMQFFKIAKLSLMPFGAEIVEIA